MEFIQVTKENLEFDHYWNGLYNNEYISVRGDDFLYTLKKR